VRGWLRRFAERVEAVRSTFAVWLRAVDPDPVMPDPAGWVFADAVTVIAAVAAAVRGRFGLPTVSLDETRSRSRVAGCWLRAGPARDCNTSRPCRGEDPGRDPVRCHVF
jgi:hypothetical protein